MLSPDGEFSTTKQTAHMTRVAAKCDTPDDANEQSFAVARGYKNNFPSMTEQNLMALSCVRKNKHLSLAPKPRVYVTK